MGQKMVSVTSAHNTFATTKNSFFIAMKGFIVMKEASPQ